MISKAQAEYVKMRVRAYRVAVTRYTRVKYGKGEPRDSEERARKAMQRAESALHAAIEGLVVPEVQPGFENGLQADLVVSLSYGNDHAMTTYPATATPPPFIRIIGELWGRVVQRKKDRKDYREAEASSRPGDPPV